MASRYEESSIISLKTIGIAAGVVVALILAIVILIGGFGKNNYQNWQVYQPIKGDASIVDKPGWYLRMFATVTDWPRAIQVFYDNDPATDRERTGNEVIPVTFNDGGNADMSTMVRFSLPADPDMRLLIHREFSANPENLIQAVRAHIVNCLKNSAPLMSASENQSARKAEFNQVVEEQLKNGLYSMKKVAREMKDQTDTNGKPITVYATEIITDNTGKPVIAQEFPLAKYGIRIEQFSVTGTEYDPKTRELFATKKESFLKAEQSKAEREQEVQQRLMVEQKGLREKAEVEAIANKEKAQAVIEGQKRVEVAEKQKAESETLANQKLSIAKIDKEAAETKANQELEVARIKAQAAEQESLAIITLAKAEQEKIKLAGAITEQVRVLAEIARDRDIKVAEALATIKVPGVVMMGGNGQEANQSSMQQNLFNLMLLRANGLIPNESHIAPAQGK